MHQRRFAILTLPALAAIGLAGCTTPSSTSPSAAAPTTVNAYPHVTSDHIVMTEPASDGGSALTPNMFGAGSSIGAAMYVQYVKANEAERAMRYANVDPSTEE